MEKVAAALKQEELGVPLEDIIKEMGVSRETYLRWRQGHVATTDLEQISDPESESERDPEPEPDLKNPGAEDDEK
jgi:putative transposase